MDSEFRCGAERLSNGVTGGGSNGIYLSQHMKHSQNERARLAELYAGMSEIELQELARDAESLTDAAQETLKTELSKRKLEVELKHKEESSEETAHPNLITLRQFRDIPAALLAKSVLDSEGIECFLADENTIRMDWLLSNLLGGIKLWGTEENASNASELLGRQSAEGFKAEAGEENEQPRCPQCGSANVLFEERSEERRVGRECR